jgi:hypothetical protein
LISNYSIAHDLCRYSTIGLTRNRARTSLGAPNPMVTE